MASFSLCMCAAAIFHSKRTASNPENVQLNCTKQRPEFKYKIYFWKGQCPLLRPIFLSPHPLAPQSSLSVSYLFFVMLVFAIFGNVFASVFVSVTRNVSDAAVLERLRATAATSVCERASRLRPKAGHVPSILYRTASVCSVA